MKGARVRFVWKILLESTRNEDQLLPDIYREFNDTLLAIAYKFIEGRGLAFVDGELQAKFMVANQRELKRRNREQLEKY